MSPVKHSTMDARAKGIGNAYTIAMINYTTSILRRKWVVQGKYQQFLSRVHSGCELISESLGLVKL